MFEDNNDIAGKISISPNNRMYVKYTVYGINEDDFFATINTSILDDSDKEFSIVVKREETEELSSTLDVKYGGYDDVYATLQPVASSYMDCIIDVRPHNSMFVLAEILEPPLLEKELTSIKDATARSGLDYQTLNYGTEPSMMSGYKSGEEFTSYIAFGDIDIPQFSIIENATLKLHFSGNLKEGLSIKLYHVDNDWSEYSITYRNKPSKTSLVSDSYLVDYDDRSIAFDFTDEVKDIYSGNNSGYGYAIVVEHEFSNDNNISFYTKESSALTKPKLVISYYDTRVFSAGRGQIDATIFVYGADSSDTNATLNVHSDWGKEELSSTLYVHRYDTPVSEDITTDIIVSRPVLDSSLIVARREYDEFSSVLSVAERKVHHQDSFISITREEMLSELYVKYSSRLSASIEVQRYEVEELPSFISITRDNLYGSIIVRERENLNAVITIQRNHENFIPSWITVTREELSSSILVREREHLDSVITVQKHVYDFIESILTATRDKLSSTILVKERAKLVAKIEIRQLDSEVIESKLTSTRDALTSSMTVKEREYLYATIEIRRSDEDSLQSYLSSTRESIHSTIVIREREYLDSTIFVFQVGNSELSSILHVTRDEIHVTIDVITPSYQDSTLVASKPDVGAIIWARVYGQDELESLLEVKAKDADDLMCWIAVHRDSNGAYYFIL
ncbi:DNRLRE domain-containing protein [Paenibacillus sp. J5C_2022]|uniref:DNRLRE domain-containing protein n=1 Tax=Paenibacillus sp. J5C2022 TaxID=2977129 RepID=UPI0021D366D1|nr:DNRLRE domain-containing protein [Paenibacillus sp. J5C2022]MCU6710088.1 DNRLRE domain-containing protein [Paenibacillus sp. J5C2022]